MRLVFAGTPEAAVPALDALAASAHEVCAVVSRPDSAAGRGRRSRRSAVAARADELGIPVWTPDAPGDPQFVDRLRSLRPECCPVVAYGALLPPDVLGIPAHGWVNLHFSLLPAWRGAAPVQHALLHGDPVTGATVFRIDAGLDTGPILAMREEPVSPTDTSGTLLGRLSRIGADLLVDTLDGLAEGTLTAIAQPEHGATYAPKIVPADARVRWAESAESVDRLVRACTPTPGAWTTFRGERVGLGPVRLLDGAIGVPGELSAGKAEVVVGTGTAAVALGDVRPPGRREMPAADWARGVRPEPGEAFA
ncbi:MAG: methionyl-tRNA formyltransferase [bacterium]